MLKIFTVRSSEKTENFPDQQMSDFLADEELLRCLSDEDNLEPLPLVGLNADNAEVSKAVAVHTIWDFFWFTRFFFRDVSILYSTLGKSRTVGAGHDRWKTIFKVAPVSINLEYKPFTGNLIRESSIILPT